MMNTVDRTVESHTVAKEIFTLYEHFEKCEPSLGTIKKVQGIIQRALESVKTEHGNELQAYKACLNSLGWVPGIYWSPEEGLQGHDLPTNMNYLTLKQENDSIEPLREALRVAIACGDAQREKIKKLEGCDAQSDE